MDLVSLLTSVMLLCSPNSEYHDNCSIKQTNNSMEVSLCGDEFSFDDVTIGIVNMNFGEDNMIVTITSDCREL